MTGLVYEYPSKWIPLLFLYSTWGCTCNEKVLNAMCLGAVHARTEGRRLAGLFSKHHETQQLRTPAAGRAGLGQWLSVSMGGQGL